MAEPSGRGQRIARARRRRRLSQSVLAGLVGRSESWLSQVERGLREVDSHSALNSLAYILRVDVAEFTGDEPAAPRTAQYMAAQDIERAMMAYDGLESVIAGAEADRTPDIQRLVLAVGRVNRIYQVARYEEADRMLPALIRSVETASRTCPSRDAVALSTARAGLSGHGDGPEPGWGNRAGVDGRRPRDDRRRARRDRADGGTVGLPTGSCVHPEEANDAGPRPYYRRSRRAAPLRPERRSRTAERIAPQLVRYDAATHDLLALLMRREHRASTPQLRPLAHRAGVI
jgi:transcriptional regulator with XRE-family HTH domain